ncbi:MAG: UDP-N-acetylmuramoyl-tripeptide--D-alanyl-D-alanine ligase, partial [Desulfovibrio sp.]|nr:UDP-N-acetylmuramoyl-tripeptide--D-alanyl-D-alanine ligase [Desulfovibrio sp.]
ADFSVKERSRVVYYDGEAVFGLLRCYAITHDKRLLESARRAFGHFIETEHWKHHDHWLSYAVNEMTRFLPEERYFAFGISNFKGYLDFVAGRETAYPTLLELMLAADAMLRRLQGMPKLRHLLRAVPMERFAEAMRSRAEHLLDGVFWPEFAMFFKNPARIADSFFIRHHAFRVRIDDVEHFLSAFIGYARWLEKPSLDFVPYYRIDFPKSALESTPGRCWDAAQLAEAAGGVWLAPPPRGWYAGGIVSSSGYLPYVQAPAVFAASSSGHLAKHLRIRKVADWDSHAVLEKLWKRFAGAIVERKVDGIPETFPQLLVKDGFQSLIELGIAARKRFQGTVVGVTGSVGKTTTCEMLRHVLEQDGSVFATYASHNNKIGVASVFASISRETDFAVLEMSIPAFDMLGGSVSRYIPPHVAVVTQIAEAHLLQWKDVETVARMKCRIFDGMAPGGYAVLNSDMDWYGLFERGARAHGLEVIGYGTGVGSQIRLLSCDQGGMEISLRGRTCRLPLLHPARHRAMNACAVVGVLLALGLDVERHRERIASFQPVAGRGTVEACVCSGKEFTLVDDSYNANPASMRAAIEAMAMRRTEADVLLLGDMRELGEQSRRHHSGLAGAVLGLRPSRVLLCGPEMEALWHEIEGKIPGCWFKDAEAVCAGIDAWIRPGDRLLVKSSHGTGLWKVVQLLKAGK